MACCSAARDAVHHDTISGGNAYGCRKIAKGRKRVALQIAINEQVLPLFEGRVLGFDAASAVAFSKVTVGANAVGNDIDFADASIAAITLAAGYVLATRNVRDFIGTKVQIINPWKPAGASSPMN